MSNEQTTNPAEETAETPVEKTEKVEAPVEKTETVEEVKAEETPAPAPAAAKTSPAEMPGRVVKLEDLEEELEYSKDENDALIALYDNTFVNLNEGEIVEGTILSISDKEVAVDIGFKSEGVIPRDEFKLDSEIKVGDKIEIFLDKMEDSDGQLRLSKEKAEFTKIWEKVISIHENAETIVGKIVRRIKGGMVVDLLGIDAFLPGSQIDVKPIRDFDALLNQELDFKIVKVNNLRKNIVVSRRVIVEEGLTEQREKMLLEIQKEQVRTGIVKNITDFGVFIDLGGVDGLLHITDLSWGRVNHPSEIVSLDQEIEVLILDYDAKSKRVSLGLKQLQPHPWENIEEKYPIGNHVNGKIVSITDYGAFVELEKGIEGLIHISEMSWTQHVKHPSKIVSIGEDVEAVVLNFDKDDKKISLGLKQIEPDPWTNIIAKYPLESKHAGIVRNITNFGVFVELEEGIDGLIHISDLSWTKKVRHPSEIVKKADEIDVMILSVSEEERRISLGFKQLEDNPWDSFEENYQSGTVTVGKIVRSIEKGLIVELPDGVEGFVPISEFSSTDSEESKAKKFATGEEMSLKVIDFDKENKKIVLTDASKDKVKKEASDDVKDYMEKQKAEETPDTLGDVLETPAEEKAPKAKKATKAKAAKKEKAPAEEAPAAEEAKEEKEEAPAEEAPVAEETPAEVPAEEAPVEEAKEETPAEETPEETKE